METHLFHFDHDIAGQTRRAEPVSAPRFDWEGEREKWGTGGEGFYHAWPLAENLSEEAMVRTNAQIYRDVLSYLRAAAMELQFPFVRASLAPLLHFLYSHWSQKNPSTDSSHCKKRPDAKLLPQVELRYHTRSLSLSHREGIPGRTEGDKELSDKEEVSGDVG